MKRRPQVTPAASIKKALVIVKMARAFSISEHPAAAGGEPARPRAKPEDGSRRSSRGGKVLAGRLLPRHAAYHRTEKKWQVEPANTNRCHMKWLYGRRRAL